MGETKILRRREVERRTGLSCTSLYRAMSRGDFPRPIRLGPQAVGWKASEVQAWLESRERAA